MMDGNYLYDIFKITHKLDLPDLTLGLAQLQVEKPIPEGMTAESIRRFLGKHNEKLVEAYKYGDREKFVKVVDLLVLEESEEE